jgi:hypothetical protein
MLRAPQIDLLQMAAATGRRWGLDLTLEPGPVRSSKAAPDGWFRLQCGGRARRLAAIVRQDLKPGALGAVLSRMQPFGPQAILVTDQVTPPMADALRERGAPFLDAAGNAYLPFPPVMVWVKGERTKNLPAVEPAGRAFRPAGLQVISVLLAVKGSINLPFRRLADMAGVSHGSVGLVLGELQRLGFMANVKDRRRLLNQERLLAQWAEAYARTLRSKLLLGRFQAEGLSWLHGLDPAKSGLLLGGEPAADRLTHHLRPGTATFYGETVEPRFLVEHRMHKDPAGNVDFRRKFWHFDGEEAGLVPTVLVYADLLAIGDPRCLETANLLLDRIHAGFI